MYEPDVTLTDFAVCLQCTLFALLARKAVSPAAARPAMLLFASLAVGALAGGISHGFLPDENTVAYDLVWRLTLLALGFTACALWWLGASLSFGPGPRRIIVVFALLDLAVYGAVVMFLSQRFVVAILNYVPATLFLLVAFWRRYHAGGGSRWLYGILAIVLTFVGAAVQQLGLASIPGLWTANASYHLIQIVAQTFLFVALRTTAAPTATLETPPARHLAG